MKQKRFVSKLIVVLCLCICAQAQSTTPQQQFQQYVADLQKNPSDDALRGKIIALVQTMKPAPAISEAEREHYVMATTFVESAKDNSGYERAIEEYKAALLAAPWWADAYKKLAIAQKAAAHYDDAIASLNFYLLTQPADARDAQDEIYKFKALKQTAAEQQLKEIERQREQQRRAWEASPEGKFEALLKKIDGRKYVRTYQEGRSMSKDAYEIRGGTFRFTRTDINPMTHEWNPTHPTDFPIKGYATRSPIWDWIEVVISEDGEKITQRSITHPAAPGTVFLPEE